MNNIEWALITMESGGKFVLLAILAIYISIMGISFAQEIPDCVSCHNEVRHGQQNNSFCINCHINFELNGSKHASTNLTMIPYIHKTFDWEADNQNEAGLIEDESCPACHVSIHEMISARVDPTLFRICEDCHLEEGIGTVPGTPGDWNLRSDIDDIIPKVYAHYTGSSTMNVKDQSGVLNGSSISSCFDYNPDTGQGTCHGVGEMFSGEAGGYFAVTNSSIKSQVTGLYNKPSDPYQLTVTIDNMPDTSDCMFCHYQENESIRLIWGRAVEPTSESHINLSGNPDCWNCHTLDNKKPDNFHSNTMGAEEEETTLPWGLIGAIVISIIVIISAAYYFVVLKKK
ncbi:MAG: hypothetical protein E4G94_00795 [ANME-2 cluster archaeon]|nr:MAG: hypothetical protein E4G94_00795 [ANME-2 cluster archaeon]